MAKRLRSMVGGVFVEKLLQGERDFKSIKLQRKFDLGKHPAFAQMQDYLKGANLIQEPILFEDSDLAGLNAPGLYIPYTQGNNINLKYANLRGANISYSFFIGADFSRAVLHSANLVNSDVRNSDFSFADMRNSRLRDAGLYGVCLRGTDLRRAEDLNHARGLSIENYEDTIITQEQEEMLRKKYDSKRHFDVRE